MVTWCRRASWSLLLAACATGGGPTARGVGDPRIAVRIDFEPALATAGELEVAHESGERFVVAAPPSGVDLRLLPGPVALVLRGGGGIHQCVLRIAPGMAPFVWRLGG